MAEYSLEEQNKKISQIKIERLEALEEKIDYFLENLSITPSNTSGNHMRINFEVVGKQGIQEFRYTHLKFVAFDDEGKITLCQDTIIGGPNFLGYDVECVLLGGGIFNVMTTDKIRIIPSL